jgi:cell division protein FtsB
LLDEYRAKMEEIKTLLNSSENRDYISKIAREELNLYFADAKIFHTDMN